MCFAPTEFSFVYVPLSFLLSISSLSLNVYYFESLFPFDVRYKIHRPAVLKLDRLAYFLWVLSNLCLVFNVCTVHSVSHPGTFPPDLGRLVALKLSLLFLFFSFLFFFWGGFDEMGWYMGDVRASISDREVGPG
jgi:hypothetical protein